MWRRHFLDGRAAGEDYARSLTMVYQHGPLVTCRVLGRYKLTGEAANEDIMPCMILDGFWEAWITRLMLGFIKPGFVCVDVGANVGYFTLVMAELAGEGGRVIAYEPEPETFDLLVRNVRDNGFAGRVRCREVGCGSARGHNTLHVSRRISGGSTVGVPLPEAYEGRPHPIDIVRLDEDIPGRVDFIKCDAEGFDAEVFMGAEGHFRRNPALVMLLEFDPAHANKVRPMLEYARQHLNVVPWTINAEGEVSRADAASIVSGPFTNFVLARG